MTSHSPECDTPRQSKLEACFFLAGCLLVLLACGGTSTASRGPIWPGVTDPRLTACDSGDSAICNQVGEEMWQQGAYSEARDWFTVSCARMDDVVTTAQRMVELGAKAKAAQKVADAAAQGDHVSAAESSAALETIGNLRPEGQEIRARIEGCVRVGDTHHMQYRHAAAQPYFDTVCKLRGVQAQAEPLIPGLSSIVVSACDASEYSRQAAAADAASRSAVGGLLAQSAPSAVPVSYQRAAAPTPAPISTVKMPAPASVPVVCADYGASCEADPVVLEWKQQCASDARAQAPCYCAVAATFECLIAHGCYAEAGARRADGQVSDTRLSSLQLGTQQNAANAQHLGKSCW